MIYLKDSRHVSRPAPRHIPAGAPFPEKNSILGVIYEVLLWADMNAATLLGARGCSVIAVGHLQCFGAKQISNHNY